MCNKDATQNMKWKSYTKTNTRVPDTAPWLTTRRAREVVEKERSVHHLLTEVGEMGPSMIPTDECRVQSVLTYRELLVNTQLGKDKRGDNTENKTSNRTQTAQEAQSNTMAQATRTWKPQTHDSPEAVVECKERKTRMERVHDAPLPSVSKAQPFLRPLFPFSLITFWETALLFQILVFRVNLTRHAKSVWRTSHSIALECNLISKIRREVINHAVDQTIGFFIPLLSVSSPQQPS